MLLMELSVTSLFQKLLPSQLLSLHVPHSSHLIVTVNLTVIYVSAVIMSSVLLSVHTAKRRRPVLSPNAPVPMTHFHVKMTAVTGVCAVGNVFLIRVDVRNAARRGLAPNSMTQNHATTINTVNGVMCAMIKDSVY